ncbi:MAG: radical SAM family heme chaperone HemW, partial [Longimicrobiales bacterium]
REGREEMADEDRYAAEYLHAHEGLAEAGFEHYEVSNFAWGGARSRHNAAYLNDAPYLGLGAGAHSYVDGVRWWNERDWASFHARVRAAGTARAGEERTGRAEQALERAWLGLRTNSGIALDSCSPRQQVLVDGWLGQGWAVVEDGRVRLTAAGWLLLDRLSVELDAAA